MESHVYNPKTVGVFFAEESLRPRRATEGSAGYDFIAPERVVVPAHSTVKFGSKVHTTIREGYVLKLYIRSSLGLKHGISLPNSVAVIDSDYRDEIIAALRNDSDEDFILEKGDRYMQGIFEKYYLVEGDKPKGKRTGGVGSTGK